MPAVLVSLHWETVIHDHLKTKEYGGPFEPVAHADEAERRIRWRSSRILRHEPGGGQQTLRVHPEEDTGRGARYHRPIKGHEHIGLSGSEVNVYPEGVIGSPTLARAEKAYAGLNELLDYMCKLITDIMTAFPAGKLPPADMVTQRDPKEIEDLLKGPLNGGKHIYTVAYPP